ncbi:MAG: heavy-metal-associated domain-containing protein [Alkalibacterium sp.]|nr:heavy-metal-associated domain-containing protein [Alkalibacterium sp.]
MTTITFQLEKSTCPSCMQKIIDNVNELTGIETIKILFDRSKARVVFEDNKYQKKKFFIRLKRLDIQQRKYNNV